MKPSECNLDSFVDPKELEPWINAKDVPWQVTVYAIVKKLAMECRLDGDVIKALHLEKCCDEVYKSMGNIRGWRW